MRLPRWWKWTGGILLFGALQLFFIVSWHSQQLMTEPEHAAPTIEIAAPKQTELQTDKHNNLTTSWKVDENLGSHNSNAVDGRSSNPFGSNTGDSNPNKETINNFTGSSEVPYLVYCGKLEGFLLPIRKHFKLVDLASTNAKLPPWNATVLLIMTTKVCTDHPYVKESVKRREESAYVDASNHSDILSGEWKDGIYFPHHSTPKFMRSIKNRPALMKARSEVFWRANYDSGSDVDFVWDRHTENPSNESFIIHYVQGAWAAHFGQYPNLPNDAILNAAASNAIFQGKIRHPWKPQEDENLQYTQFCSFLIRSDPNSLVKMFQSKNYDIDAIVRHVFFKQLSKYKPCNRIRNSKCEGSPYVSYKCMQGAKFHITMENSQLNGYISEKVFMGALGGGIPIYFGAPDIGLFVNEEALIHCSINRTVIREMSQFYPRVKKPRPFLFNRTSFATSLYPTEEELLEWAGSYLHEELEPCMSKVIELDNNETHFRKVLQEPFINNPDILDGMYPLRGLKLAYQALTTWSILEKGRQKPLDPAFASGPFGNDAFFCEGKGSLHQISIDMFNYSSPPGSPSYTKLKHILQSSSHFYIDSPKGFFTHTQQSVERMLTGYGLENAIKQQINHRTIVVDTYTSSSACPLETPACLNQPRLYIQSEQFASNQFQSKVLPKLHLCHQSPKCIIMEFSEYTYNKLKESGLGELKKSTVLLPVMTQSPSRLSLYEPSTPKQLDERSHEIVFFGYLGWKSQRRRDLREQTKSLAKNKNWTIMFETNTDIQIQSEAYKNAKVCLIPHAYDWKSGGEYHRLSELGPFGCVPVLENFSDNIGIESYQRCGGAVFANYDDLLTTAEDVISKVDQGLYSSRSIKNWWKAGITWDTILPSLFNSPDDLKSYVPNHDDKEKKEMICWSPVSVKDEDSLCRVMRIVNTTASACDEYLFAAWEKDKNKLVEEAAFGGANFVFLSDPCQETKTCKSRERGKWGLGLRSKLMWKYIHKNYPASSWFWRIDDDTFFSGANARKYMSLYDPQKEYLFGLQINKWVSGMAFAISKAALDKMVNNFDNRDEKIDCSLENWNGDDKATSLCLASLGVPITDMKDKHGYHYLGAFFNGDAMNYTQFLPFPGREKIDQSTLFTNTLGSQNDIGCCSNDLIAYHAPFKGCGVYTVDNVTREKRSSAVWIEMYHRFK